MQQAGGGHVQLPRNIHEIQQLYASMGGAVPQNIPESSAYATFQNDLNATCAAAEGDDNRWMAHWVSLQVMPQAVLCRVLDATDSDAYDISKTRLWRKATAGFFERYQPGDARDTVGGKLVMRRCGTSRCSCRIRAEDRYPGVCRTEVNSRSAKRGRGRYPLRAARMLPGMRSRLVDCKSAAMAKLFIIMPARLPGRPGTCVVGGIAKGQCVEITYYHDRAATSSPRHMCGGRHGKSAALAGLRIAMPVRLPFHLNTCLVGDCKRTIMSKLRIT
eukprot:GEMP01018092.1.p1 GENE.GEMP01018092.1~~GEMP01018092.1.p1  ORF type:complete len:274 (+),score=45.96 GEMP01018092.1:316-1137(+)